MRRTTSCRVSEISAIDSILCKVGISSLGLDEQVLNYHLEAVVCAFEPLYLKVHFKNRLNRPKTFQS